MANFNRITCKTPSTRGRSITHAQLENVCFDEVFSQLLFVNFINIDCASSYFFYVVSKLYSGFIMPEAPVEVGLKNMVRRSPITRLSFRPLVVQKGRPRPQPIISS